MKIITCEFVPDLFPPLQVEAMRDHFGFDIAVPCKYVHVMERATIEIPAFSFSRSGEDALYVSYNISTDPDIREAFSYEASGEDVRRFLRFMDGSEKDTFVDEESSLVYIDGK